MSSVWGYLLSLLFNIIKNTGIATRCAGTPFGGIGTFSCDIETIVNEASQVLKSYILLIKGLQIPNELFSD